MFFHILGFGATHRKSSLTFLLLVSLFMAMGVPRLTVEINSKHWVDAWNPDKAAYSRIVREFGNENRTMVFVQDMELWSPGKLAALEQVHRALREQPLVEHTESIFDLRGLHQVGNELEVRPLLTEAPKDSFSLQRIKEMAATNPLWEGYFHSKDGTATAIYVVTKRDRHDKDIDRKIHSALEAAIAPHKGKFNQLFQVGMPRIRTELERSILDQMVWFFPICLGVLMLSLLFFLRSVWGVFLPFITGGITLLWTCGMMGWLGVPLNVLNGLLPFLVVVMGTTDVIHLLVGYSYASKEERVPREAVRLLNRRIGVPLVLTFLTTYLVFASNLFSDITTIQHFAMASAFAVVVNGLMTTLLVPMVLVTFNPQVKPPFSSGKSLQVTAFMDRIFNTLGNSLTGLIIFVIAMGTLFLFYQTSTLFVDTDPLASFGSHHPLNREVAQINQYLTGTKSFYVTLESEQEKAFLRPQNLAKLVDVQNFLKSQEVFDQSTSIVDLLAKVNQGLHKGKIAYAVMPENRDLVAQYLLFFHQRDTRQYLSKDLRRANIVVRHHINDSKTLNRNVAELKEALAEITGGSLTAHVVGENLMINQVAEGLLASQIKFLSLFILVGFLILSGIFTSFKGGLIAIAHNLVPIILVFGTLAVAGIPLNPATVLVAAIAMGFTINNTIRILSRYNELCNQAGGTVHAMDLTMGEENGMILASSVVLALGFGVLSFSDFTLFSQFGLLMMVTVLVAMVCDLLLTPLLFSRMRMIGLAQILEVTMPPAIMKKSQLFQGLTSYQMRKAILIAILQEYEEGDLLVEQGTMGRNMFFILSGRVAVSRRMENSSLHLATLESGSIFGEIGYVKEIQRTADVRALEKVQVLVFECEHLKKNLKFFPSIVANLNFNISQILGERLADTVKKLEATIPPK